MPKLDNSFEIQKNTVCLNSMFNGMPKSNFNILVAFNISIKYILL